MVLLKGKKSGPYSLIILIAIALASNLLYGFSWTDEGLYLSNASRLIAGERLVIDDWTPTQFYEPLLCPVYYLYLKLNGSAEGIFLFFRIATLLFQFFVSIFTYSILSKKCNKSTACCAALIPLIFSRACINGPSYYTICYETFILGLLFLYVFFELSNNKAFLFLSGISFACAVLCNPFLVIPYVATSALCLALRNTRKRVKQIALVWAGTILIAVIYIYFVFMGNSLSDIIKGFHFTYNDPSYKHTAILTLKRLYKMPRLLLFPYTLTFLPIIAAWAFISVKKISLNSKTKRFLYLLNVLLFFSNCLLQKDCGSAALSFFHFTFFTCLILSDFKIKQVLEQNKKELIYFVVPGLILAYFFCFASDTGFGVCSIGMAVSCIGEIIIHQKNTKTLSKTLIFVPMAILIGTTYFYRVNLIYRDNQLRPHVIFMPKFHKNIARIERGPAKGIYTAIERRPHYDSLYDLINSLARDSQKKTILISGVATWAYMASPNVFPASPTTWRIFCNDSRLKTYFEEFPKRAFPNYVLLLNSQNPDNGGKYSEKNNADNIKDTWLINTMEKAGFQRIMTNNGLLYKQTEEN